MAANENHQDRSTGIRVILVEAGLLVAAFFLFVSASGREQPPVSNGVGQGGTPIPSFNVPPQEDAVSAEETTSTLQTEFGTVSVQGDLEAARRAFSEGICGTIGVLDTDSVYDVRRSALLLNALSTASDSTMIYVLDRSLNMIPDGQVWSDVYGAFRQGTPPERRSYYGRNDIICIYPDRP